VLRRLRQRRRDDAGFTLVEFVVASAILSTLLTVFLVSVQSMAGSATRVQAVADSATQARQALDRIGRQLAYASAVNTPVLVGQNWYLEYETDAVPNGGLPTCTQWRLVAASDQLQVRSWSQVDNTPSSWTIVARSVVNDPATQPPFAVYDTDSGYTLLRVGVDLRVQLRNAPVLQNQAQYTLRNSADAPSPSATTVCTTAGRP
jgi:prepilin-type N-terminal cleavage/methylation domain-containing protein